MLEQLFDLFLTHGASFLSSSSTPPRPSPAAAPPPAAAASAAAAAATASRSWARSGRRWWRWRSPTSGRRWSCRKWNPFLYIWQVLFSTGSIRYVRSSRTSRVFCCAGEGKTHRGVREELSQESVLALSFWRRLGEESRENILLLAHAQSEA